MKNKNESYRANEKSKKKDKLISLLGLVIALQLTFYIKDYKDKPLKPSKKEVVSTMKQIKWSNCFHHLPPHTDVMRVKIKAISSGDIVKATLVKPSLSNAAAHQCIERNVNDSIHDLGFD